MTPSRQPARTASGAGTARLARSTVRRRRSVVAHADTRCNSAVMHLACKLYTERSILPGLQLYTPCVLTLHARAPRIAPSVKLGTCRTNGHLLPGAMQAWQEPYPQLGSSPHMCP